MRFLRTRPYGVAALNGFYDSYKRGAKDRNLSFDLTLEDFKSITQQDCFYCGVKPIHIVTSANNRLRKLGKSKNDTGNYLCNGVDRKDNTKGYDLENCVACCKRCNRSKMEMSIEEFREWIERVYNHWIREE